MNSDAMVRIHALECPERIALLTRLWKPRKSNFGSGTLWKYAQTVGPAYLGAPTHPGKKKEVKTYSDI